MRREGEGGGLTSPARIRPSSQPKVFSEHRTYILNPTAMMDRNRQMIETVKMASDRPASGNVLAAASSTIVTLTERR